MLGSVTVLPALLSLLGDRVDFGPHPVPDAALRRAGDQGGRFWGAVLGRVLRPAGGCGEPGRRRAPGAAGRARARHEHREAEPRQAAAGRHADHADLQPHRRGVPRRPRPGRVVVKAGDITAPGCGGRSPTSPRQAVAPGRQRPIQVTTHAHARTSPRSTCRWPGGTDAAVEASAADAARPGRPDTLGKVPGCRRTSPATCVLRRTSTPPAAPQHRCRCFVFVLGFAFLLMLVASGRVTIAAVSIAAQPAVAVAPPTA